MRRGSVVALLRLLAVCCLLFAWRGEGDWNVRAPRCINADEQILRDGEQRNVQLGCGETPRTFL